jgi:hypothetical protein
MLDTYINLPASDISSFRALLARLVEAIERLSPPLPSPGDHPPVYQSTLEDLHTIDDAASERAKAERAALAEHYGVMPDSPAFDRAVLAFEQEMRRVHGEDTTVDWPEAFSEAQRDLHD